MKAKGLEFSEVALIGFFGWIERRGCSVEWQNCLRWLSSDSKVTVTSNTGQRVAGVLLEDCDYTLSHPQIAVSDMLFEGLLSSELILLTTFFCVCTFSLC